MTTSSRKNSSASADDQVLVETPATDAPATDAPATDVPATDAPAADAPAPVETPAAPPVTDTAAPDPDKVTITLAHPVDKPEDLRYLGLAPEREVEGKIVKGYQVHDKVVVNRAAAQSLINAGYAQVDPEDKAAVAAVLNPSA